MRNPHETHLEPTLEPSVLCCETYAFIKVGALTANVQPTWNPLRNLLLLQHALSEMRTFAGHPVFYYNTK